MHFYPSITEASSSSNRDWKNNHKWYIQEKVDGSQLTVRLINNDLIFSNKNKTINIENKLFQKTCNYLQLLKDHFNPEYTYHGECINDLRHNTIQYEKLPPYHFILYDIQDKNGKYLPLDEFIQEADKVGIMTVQTLYDNSVEQTTEDPYKIAKELIKKIENGEIESCLGGIPEGVVLKHPTYDNGQKIVATKLKFVTKQFKERNKISKTKLNNDIKFQKYFEFIGKHFDKSARFQKAYQHLLEQSKEISEENMNTELDNDFDKEYREFIIKSLNNDLMIIVKNSARKSLKKYKYQYSKTTDIEFINITVGVKTFFTYIGKIFFKNIEISSEIDDKNIDKNNVLRELNNHIDTLNVMENVYDTYGYIIKKSARISLSNWLNQK